MKIEQIAKICHQANKAFCESIGDFSQVGWETSPAWQKASAVAGVMAVVKNPDITPEESHAGWLKQRTAEGWTYDKVKDPVRLVHPCMVPYEELPEAQRYKDILFIAVCRSVIGLLEDQPVKVVEKEVHPDAQALAMDSNKPEFVKPAVKTLPSGKAMPVVKKVK